jgi:Leucine Rich Repeat
MYRNFIVLVSCILLTQFIVLIVAHKTDHNESINSRIVTAFYNACGKPNILGWAQDCDVCGCSLDKSPDGVYVQGFRCGNDDDNANRIVSIDMSNLGLVCDHIPVEIGDPALSSSLVSIDLSNNHFSGEIPDVFANLTQLQIVDLSFNQLTGNVPLSLLQRNAFVNNIGQVVPLELSLQHNLLTSISSAATNISNATVDLSHNQFTQFPTSIRELVSLDLSHNQITGSYPANLTFIPVNFGDVGSPTVVFSIANNRFSGHLPSTLGTFHMYPDRYNTYPSISTFDISNNAFGGPMPKSLGAIWYPNAAGKALPPFAGSCMKLNMHNCSLEGPISDLVWNITGTPGSGGFCELDLSMNNLKYQFTADQPLFLISDGQAINSINGGSFNLSWNAFSGEPPSRWFSILPGIVASFAVVKYDLSHNSFTGDVSSKKLFLWNFTESADGESPRFYFYMSHNQFSGNLPDNWVNQTAVYVVDFSFNGLNAPFPMMGNAGVTQLNLANNLLHGQQFPPKWSQARSRLQRFEIQNNGLVGKLPASFSLVASHLDMSNNDISGPIANLYPTFSQQTDRGYMDLSRNKFSGSIPAELFMMTANYIDVTGVTLTLNVSHNMLNGSIPAGQPDPNFPTPGICATPLGIDCTFVIDLSWNQFTYVPECVADMPGIATQGLGANGQLWLNLSNNDLTQALFPLAGHKMTQEWKGFDFSGNVNITGFAPLLCSNELFTRETCSVADTSITCPVQPNECACTLPANCKQSDAVVTQGIPFMQQKQQQQQQQQQSDVYDASATLLNFDANSDNNISDWLTCELPELPGSYSVLFSVQSVPGKEEAYATGAWQTGSYNSHQSWPLLLHYKNASWTMIDFEFSSGNLQGNLNDMEIISETDMWLVGDFYDPLAGSASGYVGHYDGHSWTNHTVRLDCRSASFSCTDNPQRVTSVSASASTGDVWAIIQDSSDSMMGIVHLRGKLPLPVIPHVVEPISGPFRGNWFPVQSIASSPDLTLMSTSADFDFEFVVLPAYVTYDNEGVASWLWDANLNSDGYQVTESIWTNSSSFIVLGTGSTIWTANAVTRTFSSRVDIYESLNNHTNLTFCAKPNAEFASFTIANIYGDDRCVYAVGQCYKANEGDNPPVFLRNCAPLVPGEEVPFSWELLTDIPVPQIYFGLNDVAVLPSGTVLTVGSSHAFFTDGDQGQILLLQDKSTHRVSHC